jgi:hypothetical protein
VARAGTRSAVVRHPFVAHVAWALPWCLLAAYAVRALASGGSRAVPSALVTASALVTFVVCCNVAGLWIEQRTRRPWHRMRLLAWSFPPVFALVPLLFR